MDASVRFVWSFHEKLLHTHTHTHTPHIDTPHVDADERSQLTYGHRCPATGSAKGDCGVGGDPRRGWDGAGHRGELPAPGSKGKAALSKGDARTLCIPPHARGKERAGIFWTEGGEEREKVMNNLNKSAAELRRGGGRQRREVM